MTEDWDQRVDSLIDGDDLKPRAVDHTITATCSTILGEDALKVGRFGDHDVYTDEPATVGGQDEWPPPLGYAALAIGF